jgi:hypothetical protein
MIWGSNGLGGQLIIFDADSNQVIDNAERLGGQLPAYYLDRASHSGLQPATTVTYNNTTSGLIAGLVQDAIDELSAAIDDISSGSVTVGNATQLNSQPASYYLDRANHTGTHPASVSTFANGGTGYTSTDVQAAIVETDARIAAILSGATPAGDSVLLNGQTASHYLSRANHTGSQPANTVTYDNTVSGLLAADVQAAIDEVDAAIDGIISGTTPAGDSLLLEGNNSAYHLNRANHTGTQPATTVIFDNTGTGLVATNVQAAIAEFKAAFDTHTHTKSQITDFVEADYVHTNGAEFIAGTKTFGNDVVINGNLTVAGTQTFVNSMDMRVQDNEIELNSGEAGNGVSLGTAGIRIKRGLLTDALFYFDEADDKFKKHDGTALSVVGDMEKSVYDADNDGIVDLAENANAVGGQSLASILSRANHTGVQPATTVAYSNGVSGLVATQVQAAIDELASTRMAKAVYDTNNDGIVNQADLATDSLKLNNQPDVFYLNRANHTGTQPATTVSYNNSSSGAVADDAQEAIDELFFTRMRKLTYDTNEDGKVNQADSADNALNLGGQAPNYYLNRINHTGSQPATSVAYNNTVSGLVATQVQAAIDELKTMLDSVSGGAGDMFKAVYDTNNDGKVNAAELADNAVLFGNQNGAYYLNRANHTGTQNATSVAYDNTSSGLTPAATVQVAIDSIVTQKMNVSDYDTLGNGNKVDAAVLADNATQFNGQNATYYLNRTNHTGVQGATTVTFNNAGTGLAATDVQAALAELALLVDANNDDVVDLAQNANNLGGQPPAYYLNRANHTGGIATADIVDAGAPNGAATLDGSGKLNAAQLPVGLQGAMIYQQTWNAATNTPMLQSGIGVKGHWYRVSVAGSTSLDGVNDWEVGDDLYYDGSVWRKNDNTTSAGAGYLVLAGPKAYNDDVSTLEFGRYGYYDGYIYYAIVQGTGGAGRWARAPVATDGF